MSSLLLGVFGNLDMLIDWQCIRWPAIIFSAEAKVFRKRTFKAGV
jgi:hypothetical protein